MEGPDGADLIGLVAAELEQAERQLKEWLRADAALADWKRLAHELQDHFTQVAAQLHWLPEASRWSPELLDQTRTVLESLCRQFGDAAEGEGAVPGQESIQLAATNLLDACQKARGAVSAAVFVLPDASSNSHTG
jgi:hypothetical protein